MTPTDIMETMCKYRTKSLSYEGKCHDCDCDVLVIVDATDHGEKVRIEVTGGAVYCPDGKGDVDSGDKVYLKCPDCHDADPMLGDFRETEIYSRVVGYMRPVRNWNAAKQAEFRARIMFDPGSIRGNPQMERATQ